MTKSGTDSFVQKQLPDENYRKSSNSFVQKPRVITDGGEPPVIASGGGHLDPNLTGDLILEESQR